MRPTVPRKAPKALMKRTKPHLRLRGDTDLLVNLNFLLFLHRLAEEARTIAVAEKSKIVKYEHVLSSAKSQRFLGKTVHNWSPWWWTGLNPCANRTANQKIVLKKTHG
nr:centromere protein W isoform X1 [Anolis sagrei ordinatus]